MRGESVILRVRVPRAIDTKIRAEAARLHIAHGDLVRVILGRGLEVEINERGKGRTEDGDRIEA